MLEGVIYPLADIAFFLISVVLIHTHQLPFYMAGSRRSADQEMHRFSN